MSDMADSETILISQLMQQCGVKFGTSGARGLAVDMTDRVCYAYTLAFMQFLAHSGDVNKGDMVAIAGDYRPSSPHIMAAVAMAVSDAGFKPVNCGFIPTPAVALYAMGLNSASIMVTGSHIPVERNGIKFYKPTGEVLKHDEQMMCAQSVEIMPSMFDAAGCATGASPLPPPQSAAHRAYVQRYLDFFPGQCLAGRRIGVYEHSSVVRDMLVEITEGLGADVVRLGRSESFIPVDTEAIRPEDVALGRQWAAEHGLDCIISADGDGDRPLISDEHGNWLRGDVAGILCARYLGATYVATPVSSNNAVEISGWFERVERTRIGSPYVIAAMNHAIAEGEQGIVGYEANGGFLTATDIEVEGRLLRALPTRDAVIVPLSILLIAAKANAPVSGLLQMLPRRFTSSGRLKAFPSAISQSRLADMCSGDSEQDKKAAEALLGEMFGEVAAIDSTDGIRITFASQEVVHLRPSGNAPELRCYNEAASEHRAAEMNRMCLDVLEQWRK
jgi:phosphomannomutase